MSAERIRVMLVDDHPVVRAGYARFLEQAGDMTVVAEAGSENEAMARLAAGATPDVLVTDLAMPGGGYGLNLIVRVLARRPQCRAIVFSMHEGQALMQRALQAGAMGFLSKRAAPQLLVQAIRSVHAGLQVLAPENAATHAAAGPADDAARVAALSPREFALFELLAQGHAVDECASLLGISSKTVSNQQTLLRDKLGVATSAGMVHLALRSGVIKPPTE